MKKINAIAILSVLFLLKAGAQQLPLYSQMYFMRLLYNPALTAYNGSSNVYGFYREQWTNMPGHPVTRGVVADVSLWKDRIGAGVHVYNDNTDIIHRLNAQAYYAQKIKLGKDHLLSLGFSMGLMEAHVDFNNAIPADAEDPHLLVNGKGGVAFDMNVGLAYQWKKLTVSFSIPQVVNTNATIANQTNTTDFSNKRHFVGGVSYEISVAKEKFNIEPSILVKNAGKIVQLDANVMANYKRIAYLGVGYRLNYGVSFMAAARISQAVTIGYAYELPVMSQVKYADTKGTHEVIFGIHFDKWFKKKGGEDVTPKLDMIDSLLMTTAELKKNVDSALQSIDTMQKQQIQQTQQSVEQDKELSEHDKQLKDLKQHIDSIQNMVKDSLESLDREYRKHVKQKPAVNFPEKVDKNTKVSKGDIFRLNRVEYDRNSSFLKSGSYTELDKVITFMNLNPNAHIRVMGHTDYIASDEYNQWLSDRRAKRVFDYLADKGVETDRMTYIGFGKRNPIADNSTEEGRARNRRVEIEITQ